MTSPSKPLPLSRVLSYSSPLLAVSFASSLTTIFYVKYGADVLLVAPGAIAMIFAVCRFAEAICDPVVGFLSDRTGHRLGRRRSWVLAAALPVCVGSLMIWSPPRALDGVGLLLWLALGAVALGAALSSIQIPHSALGAELSPESRDRTRFFAFNAVMGMLGSFVALTLGMRLIRTAELPRVAAMQVFAVVGCLVLALSLWMVLRTREPASHRGRGAASPLRAYRDVWRNPHARILILMSLFIRSTYGAMGPLAVFMFQYVVGVPESTELFMGCYFVFTIISVLLWVRLSHRFEKRYLWMVCLAGSAVAFGATGLVPEGTSLSVLLPLAALSGLLGAGTFVFEPSIRAEVIDFDEHATGERKEGVYSAASQLVGKVAEGAMAGFVGLSLGWAGYVANADQSDTVKWVIRGLFGGVPALAFLVSLLLLLRFRLSEPVHAGIRRELDQRGSGS